MAPASRRQGIPVLVAELGCKILVAIAASAFGRFIELTPTVKRACNDTQGLDVCFACRVREIARTEDLDTRPIHDYVALVQAHNCNLRAVLQEIETRLFDQPRVRDSHVRLGPCILTGGLPGRQRAAGGRTWV